jgi:hypothetical protein
MIIGPPEQAMWALGKDDDKIFLFVYCLFYSIGDKIASTIIAQSVDVPTVSWSGSRKYKTIQKNQLKSFSVRS